MHTFNPILPNKTPIKIPKTHLRARSSLTGKVIKNKINPTPQADFVGWKPWKEPLRGTKNKNLSFKNVSNGIK